MTASEALLSQAVALLGAGRGAEAAALLEGPCAQRPDWAYAWFLHGAGLHQAGRPHEALAAFERAVAAGPELVQAHNARATLLAALERYAEAIEAFRQAARLAPRDPMIAANTALALERGGRRDEALTWYGRALDLDPGAYGPRLNRCALLLSLGRARDALTDADELVRRHGGRADAHFNRGRALLALDRDAGALEAADAALACEPGHLGALVDRGLALAGLGRFEQADAAFAEVARRDPEGLRAIVRRARAAVPGARSVAVDDSAMPDPRGVFAARGIERLRRCDWRGRDDFLAALSALVMDPNAREPLLLDWCLPFASLWLPLGHDVRARIGAAAARAVSAAVAVAGTGRMSGSGRRERIGPLRIGLLSPDFRDHPVASLLAPVLERHDRSRVRIHGYALMPDDGSAGGRRLRAACDAISDLTGLADREAAAKIAADGIDILIDVAGYVEGARPEILALRPAPLAAGLYYMGSSGAPWIDYQLTDPVTVPPQTAERWTEHLVRLPRTPFVHDLPRDPPPALSRAEEGLPASGAVLCCLNAPHKIEPAALAAWSRILARVPDSVLWLLAEGETAANLRTAAVAAGVDPGRLRFAARAPRERHLARLALADCFLDTFTYNAHTTAVEALSVGLPLITLAGHTAAARCATAILRAGGEPGLAVRDVAAYEELAVRLAADPAQRAAVRARLLASRASSALFDPAGLGRYLEAAYATIWTRHASGLPPAAFDVPDASGPQDGGIATS